MESFFGTLKNELVHHRQYRTRQEAIEEIREYIEVFYNRQRRHASLGDLSPAAYWKKSIKLPDQLYGVHYCEPTSKGQLPVSFSTACWWANAQAGGDKSLPIFFLFFQQIDNLLSSKSAISGLLASSAKSVTIPAPGKTLEIICAAL